MKTQDNHFSIRPFESSDWRDLKAMRLRALKMHPNLYGGNHQESSQRPDQDWKDLINDPNKAVFGLYDQDNLIGITGIFKDESDPSRAIMVMSFIEPDYRGRGLSKLLYQARIDWAREQGDIQIILATHHDDNEASRRAMLSMGFELIADPNFDWPRGFSDIEKKYILKLDKIDIV